MIEGLPGGAESGHRTPRPGVPSAATGRTASTEAAIYNVAIGVRATSRPKFTPDGHARRSRGRAVATEGADLASAHGDDAGCLLRARDADERARRQPVHAG